MTIDTTQILIVYHSRLGSVASMARLIARGVGRISACEAVLRTVPEVLSDDSSGQDIYATEQDLIDADALILGSPTRFGNMSAALKHYIDSSSGVWMRGDLVGKPAAVFTSSSSQHGGQESTLLSMMIPLIHHGMLICGLPYTQAAVKSTSTGGGPYGASHVAGMDNSLSISADEKEICMALGERVADIAIRLKQK